MKDKTYRRGWAQAAAREKLRELRGRGWSDARIGRELGGGDPITGTFIAAILREEDPKPVSKRIWDALVTKEGLPTEEPQEGETKKVEDAPTLSEQLAALTNSVNGLMAANAILAQQVQNALMELARERGQKPQLSETKG